MEVALGHLQPEVKSFPGRQPSEVTDSCLVHNFPQLALPMYPEVSSQLRESSEIVKPSQKGHIQPKLFKILVRKANSYVLLKGYRTLKAEPNRKVAPEPCPGGPWLPLVLKDQESNP